MTNSFLTKPNYVRIYGHRGARGEIAENSIEGFKHTFAIGIKAIEFDVVISKDKIPVLYHYFNLMPYLVKDESGKWLKNSELKVELVELIGANTLIHGKLENSDEVLVASISGVLNENKIGKNINLSFSNDKLHLFDTSSDLRIN